MSPPMQETEALSTIITTGQAQREFSQPQREFSQQYSNGELEGMGSRELLDGYAD
jgi:hypothetical protein